MNDNMTEKLKIKSIVIITQLGTKKYAVGVDEITEIRDVSVEWENGIDFVYHVYKGSDKAYAIENPPVVIEAIEYYKPEDDINKIKI